MSRVVLPPSLDSRHRRITSRNIPRRGSVAPTKNEGFTLAEVVIVSVVLTVLLAAVWSLFSMQQRTLERGQRLSRQSRVMLAVQRLFQDDLARSALTYSRGDLTQVASTPQSTAVTNDDPALAGSLGFSESPEFESLETLVVPQFVFSGGTDWLIVDVRRPAHQWGAFDVTSRSDDGELVSTAEVTATSNQYSRNAADAMPATAPTPFERVIYLWLTEEEVEAVTGFVFGYEDRNRTAVSSSSPEFGGATDRLSAGQTRDALGGDDRFSESEMAAQLPRRTLLRIRTDWSWPRENEDVGTTWSEALADDSAMIEMSELADELDGLTPARQAWLRRLLWSTRSAYREFHLQAGSAVRLGPETSESNEVTSTEMEGDMIADDTDNANNPSGLTNAESNWQRRLPNAREPQVDWFPEIVAGKFQYFDGTQWLDSFVTNVEQPVPCAVRLGYELDADRYPGAIDRASQEQVQRAEADARLSVGPQNDQMFANDPDRLPANSMSPSRPEFPYLVVWTYRQQASRGASSTDSWAVPLDAAESGIEKDGKESTDTRSSGFAEAFRSPINSEKEGR